MNVRQFFYALPPVWRMAALKLYYGPVDLWDVMSGRRNALVPPRSMIYTGRGDFVSQGQLHLKYLKTLGDTTPNVKILDIGSGIGRTAVALVDYLSDKAEYRGFDTVEMGVNWCKKHITSAYPNFKFDFYPLANDLYNKHSMKAGEFEFPYPANYFDRVSAMSVFTHLQPEEVENYLIQSSKVLQPGGKCIFTFFIYDDILAECMDKAEVEFNFPSDHEYYRLMDEKVKAANVAYHLNYLVDKALPMAGLKLVTHQHGYWSGGEKENKDFQDVLVFEKIS